MAGGGQSSIIRLEKGLVRISRTIGPRGCARNLPDELFGIGFIWQGASDFPCLDSGFQGGCSIQWISRLSIAPSD